MNQIKGLLREHGRNWSVIAKKMSAFSFAGSSSTLTPELCKRYFDEQRKKQGLDKIVLEYKKVRV